MEDEFEYDEALNAAYQKEWMAKRWAQDCEEAFNRIAQMGFQRWYKSFIYQTRYDKMEDAKDAVVKNLIKYFSSSDVEQYEKCAWLKRELERAKEMKDDVADVSGGFYDWKTTSTANTPY